jgi:hypothetical protein
MNQLQIDIEAFKKAAHLARFEPSGKPFKKACERLEKLERALRSVASLAPRKECDEITQIVGAALDCDDAKRATNDIG